MAGKVAICGMSTYIGKALAEELRRNYIDTVGISSSDMQQPAPDLARKLDGCIAVCNLTGEPKLTKWTSRSQYDIFSSRIMSVRSVVEAVRYCENRPSVVICLSNALVYDQYEVHDDFSTQYGNTFMAEVGQIETKEALKLKRYTPEIRIIVARTGYIMSQRGGIFPLLRKLCRIGFGGIIGDGYQCLPMVHIDDAAQALLMLATNTKCEGIYNITIPQIASMRELCDGLRRRMGRHQLSVPKSIVSILAGRASTLVEQNCKVQPQRLHMSGYHFQYPDIEEILKELTGK